MSGRIEFNFEFSNPRSGPGPRETDAMQILVMGDFSNSPGLRKDSPLSERRIYPVDIDNLDTLTGRIAPVAELRLNEDLTVPVTLSEMDDFHPDNLYRKLKVFDELRDIVRRLSNNQTFADAAAQLRAMQGAAISQTEPDADSDKTAAATVENDSATFERLLGRSVEVDGSQSSQHARSAVEKLIGAAIRDHIVPEAAPEQGVYIAAAEDAISKLMRQILQHPDFRATEALWRSLEFLVRRVELDENLTLHICDISRDELLNDFQQAGDNLEQSGLFQRLVTQGVQTPGNAPWSLIVGAYTFDTSPRDVAMLAALGAVAAQAGGPFLAAASPTILGCQSLVDTPDPHDWNPEDPPSENWDALRQSQLAAWIGLALPRMLMRLPYGENTDEIDAFTFEEVIQTGNVKELLWGNPAFACALLIAQAFTERGQQMQPGDVQDIGELPAYSYKDDGEWKVTPCSEVCLTETAMNRMLEQGLMPVVSLKNTNSVRLPRFQSISEATPLLRGQWDQAYRR